MNIKEILEKLSNAYGASGYESGAAEEVTSLLKNKIDDVIRDKMGSVIGVVRAKNPRGKVMIATHLDELALVVKGIDGRFIRVSWIGGWDRRVLIGQEVVVMGRKRLMGVVGSIPPHYTRGKKEDVPSWEELFVDVGLDEKELKKLVSIGDPVYMARRFTPLSGDYASGKALDNRASCAMLVSLLLQAKEEGINWDLYGVFTVQEEETGLGAFTSTYHINPDIGFAVDVTQGTSFGVGEDLAFPLGKGPVIATGPNIHPRIFETLKKIAEDKEIPYQIEPVPGLTGTDAAIIQIVREGIPTGLVSIPLRYMHTPVETVNLKDIDRTMRLLLYFLKEFEGIRMEVESGT